MRICILSRKPTLYSTTRLVQACEERGHEALVVNPLFCYMSIISGRPDIHHRGKPLEEVDAVIPRIGASISFYGTAVVRQFEMMGVYSLNDSVAISRSRDKLRSCQLMARKGLGLPVTAFAHSTSHAHELANLVGGAPVIVKLLEGAQGIGVVLAETKKAAESVMDAFSKLKAHYLVQEFIKEAGGSDIRCIVLGKKVVASMMRKGGEGDFRSNIHRGALAEPVKITPLERQTAVRAANIMGLDLAGVDIIRSAHGPLVMEVNSSPGLEGVEKATGKDIAGMIVRYIEENAKPRRKPARGKG